MLPLLLQVVSETNQLRINWTQAKQIIKQQRKTIKAQELQLQLLGTPPSWPEPQAAQPLPHRQPVLGAAAAAGVHAAVVAETSDAVLKYPITSAVLQSQQRQATQHSAGGHLGAAGPAQGSAGGAAPGVQAGSTAEAPHLVLSHTSELLQCTDDILKALRARTAQHC